MSVSNDSCQDIDMNEAESHRNVHSPASNFSTYSREVKYIFNLLDESRDEYQDYCHISIGSNPNFISQTPRLISASSQVSGKENRTPHKIRDEHLFDPLSSVPTQFSISSKPNNSSFGLPKVRRSISPHKQEPEYSCPRGYGTNEPNSISFNKSSNVIYHSPTIEVKSPQNFQPVLKNCTVLPFNSPDTHKQSYSQDMNNKLKRHSMVGPGMYAPHPPLAALNNSHHYQQPNINRHVTSKISHSQEPQNRSQEPPYPLPPQYNYQPNNQRKTWSPPPPKMSLGSCSSQGNRVCYSHDSLDTTEKTSTDRKAQSLSEDLDVTPPKLAPISGVLAQKPGQNLIKPIACKPIHASSTLSPVGHVTWRPETDNNTESRDISKPLALKMGTGVLDIQRSPDYHNGRSNMGAFNSMARPQHQSLSGGSTQHHSSSGGSTQHHSSSGGSTQHHSSSGGNTQITFQHQNLSGGNTQHQSLSGGNTQHPTLNTQHQNLSGGNTQHQSLSNGNSQHHSLSGGNTHHHSSSGGSTQQQSLSGGTHQNSTQSQNSSNGNTQQHSSTSGSLQNSSQHHSFSSGNTQHHNSTGGSRSQNHNITGCNTEHLNLNSGSSQNRNSTNGSTSSQNHNLSGGSTSSQNHNLSQMSNNSHHSGGGVTKHSIPNPPSHNNSLNNSHNNSHNNISLGSTHNVSGSSFNNVLVSSNITASSSHMSASDEMSISSEFQTSSGRPDSVPSLNISRVSSHLVDESMLGTPSPSDSGVGELEAMLREKDAEINTLREVMERNERAIFQVYEERRNVWLQETQELQNDYERRLKVQSRKSYKTEQVLSLQVYKLQQEQKTLLEEKLKISSECDMLKQKVAENQNIIANLKQKLESFLTSEANQEKYVDNKIDNNAKSNTSNLSCPEELALKNKELIILKTKLNSFQADISKKNKELADQFREMSATKEEVKLLNEELLLLKNPSSFMEMSTQTSLLNEFNAQENINSPMLEERNRNIIEMQVELSEIKTQLVQFKEEQDKEREQWLDEKNKVIRYQKQLQLNYVQMQRKNAAMENEIQQLTLELENRDMKLIALSGEESFC